MDVSIENTMRCQSAKLQDSYQDLLKYWRKLIISCTAHRAETQLVLALFSLGQRIVK